MFCECWWLCIWIVKFSESIFRMRCLRLLLDRKEGLVFGMDIVVFFGIDNIILKLVVYYNSVLI